MTPYFAYLPAEAIGVSAVLSAVVAGVWLGWRSPQLITPSTRMQAFAFWEILVFILNATLFVLVGLQLPHVLEAARETTTDGDLALYGFVVTAALVAARFLWVVPATYLPRLLSKGMRRHDPVPPRSHTFLVAYTGMRGAVSLAAALAIPEMTDAGVPFPGRDLIIFLVYAAILFTVVGQGLTLGPLIRRLGAVDDGESQNRWEDKARLRAARAAIARIDELAVEEWVREDTARRMRAAYDFRIRRYGARFDEQDDGRLEEGSLAYQRLRREVLAAERGEIIRLRNQGYINDEVMRRIERDLDLEHERLEIT